MSKYRFEGPKDTYREGSEAIIVDGETVRVGGEVDLTKAQLADLEGRFHFTPVEESHSQSSSYDKRS